MSVEIIVSGTGTHHKAMDANYTRCGRRLMSWWHKCEDQDNIEARFLCWYCWHIPYFRRP